MFTRARSRNDAMVNDTDDERVKTLNAESGDQKKSQNMSKDTYCMTTHTYKADIFEVFERNTVHESTDEETVERTTMIPPIARRHKLYA